MLVERIQAAMEEATYEIIDNREPYYDETLLPDILAFVDEVELWIKERL